MLARCLWTWPKARSLGNIVLTATSGGEQTGLLHSWALDGARVVSYQLHEGNDSGESALVELAFEFDAIESTIIERDHRGAEVDRLISRWEFDDGNPQVTGGGAGPYEAAGSSERVLQIGSTEIEIYESSWNAGAPFSFGGTQDTIPPFAGDFTFTTDIYQAGGLFADLAAGRAWETSCCGSSSQHHSCSSNLGHLRTPGFRITTCRAITIPLSCQLFSSH